MKRLVFWAAMAALGLSLLFVATHIEWGRFATVLVSVDPVWVVAGTVANIVSIYLRALRWAVAIPLPGRLGVVWAAVNIGYLANLVFPMRAGEIFRLGILAELAGVGLPRLTATALVDRASDGFFLVMFLAVLMGWHGADLFGNGAAWGIAIWSTAAVAAIALIIAVAGSAGRRFQKVSGRLAPDGLAARAAAALVEALASLEKIRTMRRLAAVMAAAGAAAIIDVIGAYCIIIAFGWDVSPLAALTFVVFLWIGFALPLVPGALGVYQVTGVLALALFDIGVTDAVAYAIVCQIVANLVVLVQGIGSALYFGIGPLGHRSAGSGVTDVQG